MNNNASNKLLDSSIYTYKHLHSKKIEYPRSINAQKNKKYKMKTLKKIQKGI